MCVTTLLTLTVERLKCPSYRQNKRLTNFFSPEVVDDKLETLAFGVCNTDGVEGLSWAEVEQCQVCKNE